MGGSRVRQGNLARHAESVWAQHADAPPLSASDYAFLLGRFVDRATLHRAEALAKKWRAASRGDDRQRLAQRLRLLPGFGAGLRRSLPRRDRTPRSHARCARGLLKERARGGGYVFASEKLRPNAVEEVLARLEPHRLSLASPDTLRQAVCGHFAGNLAAASVDGLHARFPDRSAKARLAIWQRLSLFLLLAGFGAALVLQAQPAFRALSLALVFSSCP